MPAMISVIFIAGFLAAFTLIHLLNPEMSLTTNPLSIYTFGKAGYLLRAGIIMVGFSEMIISMLLYSRNLVHRLLSLLLFFMGITALITGILTMDIGPQRTFQGTIHIYAAGVQFILFPFVSILYGLTGPVNTSLFSNISGILTISIVPFITVSSLIESPIIINIYGLLQKVYILVIVLWLLIISVDFFRHVKRHKTNPTDSSAKKLPL